MKVFVSYSRNDERAVSSLVSDLRRARIDAWIDEELSGGDAWWSAILAQIRGCDVFLFALSERSLYSKPCRAELGYAQDLKLPILPVQVGEVSSYRADPLFSRQLIDYRNPTGAAGFALMGALNQHADQRAELPDPLPATPPIPYEYLQRLGAQVHDPAALTPPMQAQMLFELRNALHEEHDETAVEDIRRQLAALRRRSDVTYAIASEIDAILGAKSPVRAPVDPAPPRPRAPARNGRSGGDAAPQVARPRRKLKWPLIAGVVAVVAVACIIGYLLLPGQTPQSPTANPGDSSGSTQEPGSSSGPTTPGVSDLNSPDGVAVDSDGNVYVVDAGNKQLLKLPSGAGHPGPLPAFAGLDTPGGVAVDARRTVYVTDRKNNQVLKAEADATSATVVRINGLNSPRAVAVDSADNLYLTDGSNHVLKVPAGAADTKELSFGGLSSPHGVAVDGKGTIYVADTGNNRVLKLTADAQSATPVSGNLNSPEGLAVDSAGNLYVADTGNSRVVKVAGGSGDQSVLPFKGLNHPAAVAVGAGNTVWVADTGNNRVVSLPTR
jgi:sugar lactone lactonase YvrE